MLQNEVSFLGGVVSKDGYYFDPKVAEVVTKLKNSVPKMVGEVRRIIGFLGVYRRHIEDFSRNAKPIYELLDGKIRKTKSSMINGQLPSKYPVQWTTEHKAAMDILIECITSPPILAYPE